MTTCAEQCEVVYASVSPACAAALPAAIECVAPTYVSIIPPLLTDCWLQECRPQLFDMTSVCYGLREALEAARATWEASGVTSYGLRYLANGSDVEVSVRTNGESSVTPSNAYAWTVPALFDEVERLLDLPGAAPLTRYDADFGNVTMLTLQEGCESSTIVSDVEVAPLR